MGKKVEAFVQAFLLVVAVFAFSYIANEIFGDELIGVVSAVELSDDEMSALRERFPEFTERDLRTTVNWLVEEGRLDEADASNPDAVSEALQGAAGDFESGLDDAEQTGEVSGETASIFDLFSALTSGTDLIDGGALQQNWLDSTGGIWVCPLSKGNKVCQMYIGNECPDACAEDCISGSLDQMKDDSVCRKGTCYNEDEGTCSAGATQGKCVEDGGEWFDDPNGNIPECGTGCCVAGGEAMLLTEGQCEKLAETSGIVMGEGIEYKEGNEIECIAMAQERKEGGCVFPSSESSGNDCKFTNAGECDSLGGIFWENYLCSHPDLDSGCIQQNYTGCFDGMDEVYWFDDCGNRENIFNGADSWNGGMVLPKNDSCAIGTFDDNIRNQGTCGNCNRFVGSYCGNETIGEFVQELNDEPDGGVVCRDMSCYDEAGNKIREHGESWCVYQSSIGMAGPDIPGIDSFISFLPDNPITQLVGGARATDTPGSRHFRKSCLDGEIEITPCGDFRNEICVEQKTPKGVDPSSLDMGLFQANPEDFFASITGGTGTFSQASCRINRWQECLAYNPGQEEGRIIGMAGESAGQILDLKLMATCGQDPDCFVKKIQVDKGFDVSYCSPRYAPGFDPVNEDSQVAGEQLCGQASQQCTVVYVKKIGGWECEANCDCEEQEFEDKMVDFCTSMGDCGPSVNYVGTPAGSKGYKIWEGDDQADEISSILSDPLGGVIGALYHPEDANPLPGEFIQMSDVSSVQGSWMDEAFSGIDDLLDGFGGGSGGGGGRPDVPGEDLGGDVLDFAGTTGAVGGSMLAVGLVGGYGFGQMATLLPFGLTYGGVALGAAAGMAIVGVMIDLLGIGPGLSPAMTYTLMGAGAVAGGLMAFSAISAKSLGAICVGSGGIGCIILVVVIVIIIILAVAGIGDIEEKVYNFKCQPWSPPILGDCESCGTDGMSDGTNSFPCSAYSCHTLGRNCEFVEDSEVPEEGGLCIHVEPTDVNAPRMINVIDDVLTEGFEYKNFNAGSGFKIEKPNGDQGCLDQFESVRFGFDLDEYGKCYISANPDTPFDGMVQFGSLFKNHTYQFSSMKLESLGFTDGLNSETKTDIKLNIACEDFKGNKDERKPAQVVELCVVPRDLTATQISAFPQSLLPYAAQEHTLNVNCNEPAECRWDLSDGDFADMSADSEWRCDLDGYPVIPITETETTVYVRCLDHPEWEGTDREDERNENLQSVVTTLTRSESELEIDYVIPGNNALIKVGQVNTASVEAEAKTSGGADGSADCSYWIDGVSGGLMQSTGDREHIQSGISLGGGTHVLRIQCTDSAGNVAESSTSFVLEIDSTPPVVTRVYDDSGTLVVVTNELASCGYWTNNSCGQGVDASTLMSGTGNVHSTSFSVTDTYYIKCKDEFDNEKSSGCDLVTKRGVF